MSPTLTTDAHLSARNRERIEKAARALQRALATANIYEATINIAPSGVSIWDDHIGHGDGRPLVKVPAQPEAERTNRGRGEARQPALGAETHRCSKCGDEKPIEEFTLRADRPNRRWTQCDGCRSALQRSRYLSVKHLQALNEADLEFVVGEADEVAGLRCTNCERLIRAGDRVRGTAELHHASCPR